MGTDRRERAYLTNAQSVSRTTVHDYECGDALDLCNLDPVSA